MPSLTKKIIRGRPYYYLRECKRVNGKPKIVSQVYLGSAADIMRRLADPAPLHAVVREFGASAACLQLARQLGVADIVDRHVSKRGSRGPCVGQYLLIAALNRCLAPRSKARLADWYQDTCLPRLLGVKASQLTSQRFWDNMDRVDSKAIESIERDLVQSAVCQFGLDLRCLLFDATNFFTFVDSFNLRSKLPQRGHSKEGRAGLRIVGLALLVTADGEVPLMHHCYAGNQHDATTFGNVIAEISDRCRKLSQRIDDLTLVFDKGNNSEDNLTEVANAKLHFVGSLPPTQHRELLGIERRKMTRLDTTKLPAVWSYRTKKVVFGTERTVLVTFNRPLFSSQVKTLRREINKRQRQLENLKLSIAHSCAKSKGRKPSITGTRKRVAAILRGRHMKDLFSALVEPDANELPAISWSFNKEAWKRLQSTLLGKTILFTDRQEWSDEHIVLAYRSQSHVESAFRAMKNPLCLALRPIHHWTDQKLRVHALYSVIALMILTLLRRKLSAASIPVSLARMVEQLSDINEVTLVYQSSDSRALRARTVLSELDSEQQSIFDALGLASLRAA